MKLFSELKKPFNLFSTGITVISLLLSVIFYLKAISKRDISYSIDTPTSLVFDGKSSTPALHLIERDSTAIIENVYLLTGTIWNSGNLPIEKSDIRQDLSIHLSTCKRILDFKILEESDSTVSKFSLSRIDSTRLLIDWKYFDPDHGFKFQVLYCGDTLAECNIDGKILGIHNIKPAKFHDTRNNTDMYWFMSILFVCIIISIATSFEIILNRIKGKKVFVIFDAIRLFTLFFSILMIFMIIYEAFFTLKTPLD